tara:strand:+ start:1391 stop:1621 length:231 start_codon:yes stop_codon:yes gene_type:complete
MNEEWFVKIKFKKDEIDVLIESLTCMDEMKSKDRHIGCGTLLEFFKGIKAESDQKNKQIIPEETSRCGPNYCGECD